MNLKDPKDKQRITIEGILKTLGFTQTQIIWAITNLPSSQDDRNKVLTVDTQVEKAIIMIANAGNHTVQKITLEEYGYVSPKEAQPLGEVEYLRRKLDLFHNLDSLQSQYEPLSTDVFMSDEDESESYKQLVADNEEYSETWDKINKLDEEYRLSPRPSITIDKLLEINNSIKKVIQHLDETLDVEDQYLIKDLKLVLDKLPQPQEEVKQPQR